MDFEYKILCCNVAVDVAILCSLEIIVIVATYLTGFKHPLMTCQSFNVSILERYNEPTVLSQHKICTTNGPLVFWIIIHLFTDLMALISIYTKNTKLLLGFLVVTSMDLLVSLAYVVVLLAFIVLNEQIDKVMIMFMGGMVLFKIYEILTGRRLYWYLLWLQDNMMAPRSALIKNDDNSVFQF
ncbi:Inner membrane protein [Caenorhabditis elegans]|uniref:Inner membrane protein n=2 Tax=Caenorhabditis elegans TaxID=6239 RepID=Q19765_CAEEL|nr:Inner membrane protein [Caenorhabditis elegans]CAA98944.1 Inner membrane protein [Caenorhabditis elegans]|eukprot:NP_506098.1 Uncharacterized protein CELE_F23H12.7 [Caenorhabditis elegans]